MFSSSLGIRFSVRLLSRQVRRPYLLFSITMVVIVDLDLFVNSAPVQFPRTLYTVDIRIPAGSSHKINAESHHQDRDKKGTLSSCCHSKQSKP